jgi:hypothetical protein
MILATMIMIMMCVVIQMMPTKNNKGCLVWHPDSYVFLWLPLKCIRIRCLLLSTIALYFSNFGGKTHRRSSDDNQPKKFVSKEYFSNAG